MTQAIEVLSEVFSEESSVSLNYSENPAAKKLLDALVSILAEEYVQTAKQNPEIFSK